MVYSVETNVVDPDRIGHDALVEITNARFVDVVNGCFFNQGTRVIIKNRKILAVPAPETEAAAIKPDFVFDLQGKTVLPGLFNVHCHIQLINPTLFSTIKTLNARRRYHALQVEKSMADCLRRGITNIRDAFTDDLRPNSLLKKRIAKKEILGPRIQQAVLVGALGGYLTPELRGMKKIVLGFLGLGKIKYEDHHSGAIAFPPDSNEQSIRDAVDRAIDERGADLIKVGESMEESLLNSNPITMSMHQLQAITDQARQRGVQTTIHSVSVETFRRAIKVGFSSLAHMARDARLTRDDIEACLHSDSIIDPTLSVGYDMSWKLTGDPFAEDPNMESMYQFRNKRFSALAQEFWIPELRDFVVAGFDKANTGNYKMLGLIDLSKLLAHFSRLAHFGIQNTRRLLDEGAAMACGNDGGIQSSTPAMVTHELSIFDLFMNDPNEEKIFDGVAAVKAATINSARSMGIDDRFGSIRVGKTADLAVIDGDPFEDITAIGKCVDALFMDGRLVINNCGAVVHGVSP